MSVSRQGPSRVRAAQLQDRCLELRANGLSFREIARELKVAPATAYKAVARGLAAVNAGCREQAQELRALEALRLDQMQAALWQQAIEERDVRAIDRILRIMERRARLLGLDEPERRETNLKIDPQEAKFRRELLVKQILADALNGQADN
jgi:DNA-binding CsgD family transcriptional regulator